MQPDFTKLSLVALRNLFFEETRAFLAALDTETAEVLKARREKIRLIDIVIQSKRQSANRQHSVKKTSDQISQ